MTGSTEQSCGYAEICAALSARFGTRFEVQNAGGNCLTLVATLEGGIELLITDCENTLSPVAWHRDGRAAGFYVGVSHAIQNAEAAHLPDEFAYAYAESAEPTAEVIGDLICAALKNAANQPSG